MTQRQSCAILLIVRCRGTLCYTVIVWLLVTERQSCAISLIVRCRTYNVALVLYCDCVVTGSSEALMAFAIPFIVSRCDTLCCIVVVSPLLSRVLRQVSDHLPHRESLCHLVLYRSCVTAAHKAMKPGH